MCQLIVSKWRVHQGYIMHNFDREFLYGFVILHKVTMYQLIFSDPQVTMCQLIFSKWACSSRVHYAGFWPSVFVLVCDIAQGYNVPANFLRPLCCHMPANFLRSLGCNVQVKFLRPPGYHVLANFLKMSVSIKGTLCTILTQSSVYWFVILHKVTMYQLIFSDP